MSIVELKALLTYATVEWHPLVQETRLGRAGAVGSLVQDEELVQHTEDGETSITGFT